MEKTSYLSTKNEFITGKIPCRMQTSKSEFNMPNTGFIQLSNETDKCFLKNIYLFKSIEEKPLAQYQVLT